MLRERFSERALLAEPTADPGPRILTRASAALARRRRRRVTAASVSAGLVAVLGVVRLSQGSSGTKVATTPAAECSVADSCQPASVSDFDVTLPSGFVRIEPPSTTVAGQVTIDRIYTNDPQSTQTGTGQLEITIITASESVTKTLSGNASTSPWSTTSVGSRSARYSPPVSGLPAAAAPAYLQLQLSPTVTLDIRASGLSENELIGLAASMVVR